MQKQQIRNDHGHNTLIRRSPNPRDHTRGQKARVARDQPLPDVGQNTDQAAHQNDGPPADHVGGGHDEEVGVPQGHGGGAEQHVDLGQGLVELGLEEERHGRDGERRHDADEDEDELVEDDGGFPRRAPVLPWC